jgi:hypothetical protein
MWPRIFDSLAVIDAASARRAAFATERYHGIGVVLMAACCVGMGREPISIFAERPGMADI